MVSYLCFIYTYFRSLNNWFDIDRRAIVILLMSDIWLIGIHTMIILFGLGFLSYDTRWILLTVWLISDLGRIVFTVLLTKISGGRFRLFRNYNAGLVVYGLSLGLVRIAMYFTYKEHIFLTCVTAVFILPLCIITIFTLSCTAMDKYHRDDWIESVKTGELPTIVYVITMCLLHMVSFIWRIVTCWGTKCVHPLTSWTFSYLPTACLLSMGAVAIKGFDNGKSHSMRTVPPFTK